MTQPIIVFSSHTIYTEGIANLVQQQYPNGYIYFIDSTQEDYLDRIRNIQPSAVVFSTDENDEDQCRLMWNLLIELPEIIIIRLKVNEHNVLVIKSSSHVVDNVKELVDLVSQ